MAATGKDDSDDQLTTAARAAIARKDTPAAGKRRVVAKPLPGDAPAGDPAESPVPAPEAGSGIWDSFAQTLEAAIAHVTRLEETAAERQEFTARQQAETALLRTVAGERREVLERQHADAATRLRESVASVAALRSEAERSQEAHAAAVARSDVLQRSADERLALIDRLQAESAGLRADAEERLVLIQRQQAESIALGAALTALQADLALARRALAEAETALAERAGRIAALERQVAESAAIRERERDAARARADRDLDQRTTLNARNDGLAADLAVEIASAVAARASSQAALADLQKRLDEVTRAAHLQQEAAAAERARLAAAAQAAAVELSAERVITARQRAIIAWWEGMPLRARVDDALRRAAKRLVVGSITHHGRPSAAPRPVDVLILAAGDAGALSTTLRSLDLQGHPLASIVVVGAARDPDARPGAVHLPDAPMVRTVPAALAAMTGSALLVLAAGDELHPGALAWAAPRAAHPRSLVIGSTDWRRDGRIHSSGRARLRDAFDFLASDGSWTPRGYLMSHHLAAAAADDVRATGGEAVDAAGYWAWTFHILRRGRLRLGASLAICGPASLACAPPSTFAAARAHCAGSFSTLGRLRRLAGRALRGLGHARERGAAPVAAADGIVSHGAILPGEFGPPERFLFSSRDRRRGDPLISHWYLHPSSQIATCVPTLTPERLAEAYARRAPQTPDVPSTFPGRRFPVLPGLRSAATATAVRHRVIRTWLNGGTWSAGRHALCAGCHDPAQAALLATCGFATTVLSSDPAIIQWSGEHALGAFAAGTWDAHLAVPTGRLFDVIWLGETLEKWYDPAFLLRRLHPLLAPGGTLLIETPNLGARTRQRFARHWSLWDAPYRRFIFSARSLASTAATAGFAVARLRTCTGADDIARSLALAHSSDGDAVPDAPDLPAAWLAEAQAIAGVNRVLADPFGRGDWLVAALIKA